MAQTSITSAPGLCYEGMVNSGPNSNAIESYAAASGIYFGKAVSIYSDSEVELGNQRVKLPASAYQGYATKACDPATYNLADGDTMVIDVDNVGNATVTFNAAAATIVDTTTYPVTDQDGLTSVVTLIGGPYDGIPQTVTFSGATTTAASVASQANAQLDGCSVDVTGGQIRITHDTKGTGMDISVAAGTGDLTWASSTAGTGDAVDASAVTAAEIETLIEGDSTAVVTVSGLIPTISSPTAGSTSELDFISGTMLAKLGLSVETIAAPSAGDLSPTNFKGIAIADITKEATSNDYGEYVQYDQVPVMKRGRIWVVSADAVDDLSKSVYVRFQNGSSTPPADTLGSFRATANADYEALTTGAKWVAGTQIGTTYYGLLELNL